MTDPATLEAELLRLRELLADATPDLHPLWTDWDTTTAEELVESYRENLSKSRAFNPDEHVYWVEEGAREDGTNAQPVVAIFGNGPTSKINCELFVRMRNALPLLLDEIERLREALRAARAQGEKPL